MNTGDASVTATRSSSPSSAAQLTATVLDDEARRQAEQEAVEAEVLPDQRLPGVNERKMTLFEGLRSNGAMVFWVLLVIVALDELSSAALGVLAADIRDSFRVGNGTMVFIASAAGAFIVLGALPMGFLADRYKRGPIIGCATVVFSAMVFLSGLAVNAFMLFWTQFGAGIAKSSNLTVHGSMLADTYPIGIRGRVSATRDGAARLVGVLSPVLVGAIAAIAGGSSGWRWAFLILGVPVAVMAFSPFASASRPAGSTRSRTRPRRDHRRRRPRADLDGGGVLPAHADSHLALLHHRLLGDGLRSVHRADPCQPLSRRRVRPRCNRSRPGRHVHRRRCTRRTPVRRQVLRPLVSREPGEALRLVGVLVLPAAILTPVQYFMPNPVLCVVFGIPGAILLSSAFTMVGPVTTTVVPYRLRGLGAARVDLHLLHRRHRRCIPGGSVQRSHRHPGHDHRVVSADHGHWWVHDPAKLELHPQRPLDGRGGTRGRARGASPGASGTHHRPRVAAAQHRLRVWPRTGALRCELRSCQGRGTRVAGHERRRQVDCLRVIAGLGTPSRGVVRLNGRTITFVSPEQRARLGIHMLIGGKGVFPQMAVRENLEMAAFVYRTNSDDPKARIDKVLALFPILEERQKQKAGSLSGGEQQIVALAHVSTISGSWSYRSRSRRKWSGERSSSDACSCSCAVPGPGPVTMSAMESRRGPRRVEPGPQGRDEVVAAVLDAATERFSERGPSRVSIREIADAANVNHALIHRHFHTKQELLRKVMARFILDAGEQIRPRMSWPDAVAPLFEPDPRHATWARMLAWLLLESDVEVALVERFPIVETLVEIAGKNDADADDARIAVAAVELMALGWQLFGEYVVEMADLGHLDHDDLVRRLGALAARMGPGDRP